MRINSYVHLDGPAAGRGEVEYAGEWVRRPVPPKNIRIPIPLKRIGVNEWWKNS